MECGLQGNWNGNSEPSEKAVVIDQVIEDGGLKDSSSRGVGVYYLKQYLRGKKKDIFSYGGEGGKSTAFGRHHLKIHIIRTRLSD